MRNDATPARPATVPGSAIHAAFPVLAPHVEAALPAQDAPAMTAREIWRAAGFSTIATVRLILRAIVAEGRATLTVAPIAHGGAAYRYRRTAATVHTASNGE